MKRRYSRLLTILLTLALILSTFNMAAFANSDGSRGTEIPTAEFFGDLELTSSKPTTVIVQLVEESIVEAKHKGKNQSKSKLKKERDQIISSVNQNVSNAKVNREYDYLFSGFSVELPAKEIPSLLSVPGVKAVYPNVEHTVQVVSSEEVALDAYGPNMLDSAPYIGSQKAWDAKVTGKGITVAILDTGVDYTHPDLVHAFDLDNLGWDFVDNDKYPQETPAGDPRGGSTTHGTHVAGTVAANGLIKGVAPEANLLAYRVLGPGGSGSTENVLAGIERAVQDGADIMNLSLGNTMNNPDFATSIALDWAMAEGVVAVVANGNSGPNNWTVGSPGTSREAISVGATQLPHVAYEIKLATAGVSSYNSAKAMGYPNVESLTALNGKTYDLVFVGLAGAADFAGKDVRGKVVVTQRGTHTFVDKVQNAKNAGAEGVIMFNNATGEIPDVNGLALPTIKLTQADGTALVQEMNRGNNKVTFNSVSPYDVPETMATFSSRGPVTSTWMIKPDVSAPGVAILSTVPTHNQNNPHGYSASNGTSMAAPHVAGSAALLLQAHPTWGVEDVKAALMNTAEELIDPITGKPYPHNAQGAGSIRVHKAINSKTLVTPGSHSFGKFVKDSGRQVEGQSFTIKNLSNERKRYSFEVVFAGNPDGIKVMTSNNLNVQAGKSQKVNFNVQVDTSKLKPGYYEGTIKVSDGSQVIAVPTILFVGEPDYPRLTGIYFGKEADGSYYVGSYLPGGAEVLDYDLYRLGPNNTIGAFLGTIGSFKNVPAPEHEFNWNGSVNGVNLPNGNYVLAVYVEKGGVTEYRAYLVTKN
ncbi:S8 family serine peptidase [Evansella tamaricis]|uniref:S8 family serine peptidase n=1 Tax=Evansella tamaricis TaxID=2069301 RepID=A0ABS6JCE6_9BACI|nr:S8 family serine peptidase [Evansella tamaricis]MBU9711340.1 S8 family serine peptidase [Evansella tamaricis]